MAAGDRSDPFDKLSRIFRKRTKELRVIRDEPGVLYVESKTTLSRGKPLWVGGVTMVDAGLKALKPGELNTSDMTC